MNYGGSSTVCCRGSGAPGSFSGAARAAGPLPGVPLPTHAETPRRLLGTLRRQRSPLPLCEEDELFTN